MQGYMEEWEEGKSSCTGADRTPEGSIRKSKIITDIK